jgi:hypothetical protein
LGVVGNGEEKEERSTPKSTTIWSGGAVTEYRISIETKLVFSRLHNHCRATKLNLFGCSFCFSRLRESCNKKLIKYNTLSLLPKRICPSVTHIFFRKLFHVTLKNSYFEFVVEIDKNGSSEVFFYFELPFAKI